MEAQYNITVVGDRTPLPGPADYSVSRAFTDKKGVSISPRYYQRQRVLDPMYHDLGTYMGKGPKVTIGPRTKIPTQEPPPGPTYVPPKFGSDVPGVKFPRTKKPKDKANGNPGPQDYKVKYDTDLGLKGATQASIGNAKRPPIFTGDPTTPSAANYNPKFDITQPSSPRPVIGHKYREPKKDRTGEYIAPRSTLSARGCVFGRAGRTLIIHNSH